MQYKKLKRGFYINKMDYTHQLKHYPDILNADQAVEILAISKKTLYKAISNKSLPAVKIRREYRIVKTQLMKLLVS